MISYTKCKKNKNNEPEQEPCPKKSRYIPNDHKKIILERQENKCANYKGSNLYRIGNYQCPFWSFNKGYFDKSGYQFDHVIEFCLTSDNNINNLQALCPSCH